MQLKTSYYNSGTEAHSALAIESEFLSYAPAHVFKRSATCVIVLADPAGLTMQKYDVALNSVYVGSGRVIIQDPTPEPDDDVSNLIFDGRIVKARHDSKNHRVILMCQDWMSQLNGERIKYELREDLDGAGLRQSAVRTHIEGTVKQPVTRGLYKAVSKDGGAYQVDTIDANDVGVDDMELLPAVGVEDDGYLFGFRTPTATKLTINVSTAGVGAWGMSWYYSKGGGVWASLPGVIDNTLGFKAAGINTVTWSSAPEDWATDTFAAQTAYWVKGFLGWVTTYTSAPAGAWAHGGEYFMYDDSMKTVWAADQWNGKYIVFTNEMAGSITISTGPISEEIEIAPTMLTNSPADGEEAVWDDDHKYHHMADEESNYRVKYTFVQPIELSNLFLRGLTGARIKCEYSLEDAYEPAAWFHNRAWLYGADIYDSQEIGKLVVNTGTDEVTIQRDTWEIPEQYLDYVLDDDTGECIIALSVDVDTVTPTTATLKVRKIRLEVDVDLQGYANAVEITGTLKESAGASVDYYAVDAGISGRKPDFLDWAYTDETTESNNDTIDDIHLLLVQAGNATSFLFGSASKSRGGIKLIISTLLEYKVDTDTVWQYSRGAGVWKNLLNVNDGSKSLRKLGTHIIKWTIPDDWATDTFNGQGPYYYIRAYTPNTFPWDYPVTDALLGTRAWFINFGARTETFKLQVDRDLTHLGNGVGIYEGCPYSLANPIWTHIDGLVKWDVVPLDSNPLAEAIDLSTDIEETSGISTRVYDDRTRLEVILDLAKMDKAVCWCPLGTRQLKYKSTFAGGTTNMTDADVLEWSGGEYDYIPMFNEFHIGGIRIGDNRLYTETEDMPAAADPGADSKTKYGVTRTKVIASTGTTTQHDTEQLGIALVEANEDVNLFLECTIAGLSSFRLGDEINLTSTYLGLTNEKFVVTGFSYDSKTYRTQLTLHPRTSQGFVDRTPFGEHLRRIGKQTEETVIDTFIPGVIP